VNYKVQGEEQQVYDLPSYVWIVVLAGAVAMPAVAGLALHSGALAAGLGRRTANTVAAVAGAAWGGWLVACGLLAAAGAFRQEPDVARPWFGLAFAATLVATLLAARVPVVRRILADPGAPARLAWPQTLRAVGGIFLVVLALGKLPAVFAVPAGLGDIAVGVAAPFVARRLARGGYRRGAVWFNALGILDLTVAVGTGALAALGPTRLLDVTPSTEALGLLPLVLIPLTAVPLAVALHVVSLRRLRAPNKAPAVSALAGPAR
jgi:hypothetical protein